jgi:hypothetical protein
MADLDTRQDIAIYDDSGNGYAAQVVDDAGTKRLCVDAKLSGIAISSLMNVSNIMLSDILDISSKALTVYRTYTVPAGKTFYLTNFHISVDHPAAIDFLIKVDGTVKLASYLDPSAGGEEDSFMSASPVLFATAGQVVTISHEGTMPRGRFASILTGIEI